MARAPRIAIVGGGVGGLAAALALERQGAEVIVCEQSPALSNIGAGLNLSPNALMALRAVGVEDPVIAIGSELDFLVIRSWKSGRIISRMRRGAFRQQFSAPNVTVHRADLLDVLRGVLRTADVRLGARCIAVEEGDRGGVARLADGSEIEADIIVGADGIHSVVRNSLFGPDAPRFTGCICWRGMASAGAVPRDIAIAEGAMWMGPHGHVVHYPVRRGELINIVAYFDSDSWTEELWTRECDLSELTTTYAGWHSDLLRLFPCSTRWYKWATLPIVCPQLGDAQLSDLVASYARPGGTVTGLAQTVEGLTGKLIELVQEFVPGAVRVGFLSNPTGASMQLFAHALRKPRVLAASCFSRTGGDPG